MTRLFLLVHERREHGTESSVVHLSGADEFILFTTAEHTFGAAGGVAARANHDVWRAFLHTWFRDSVNLGLVFDAEETRVI